MSCFVFPRIKKRMSLMLVAIAAYSTFMYLQVQDPGQPVSKPVPPRAVETAREAGTDLVTVAPAGQAESPEPPVYEESREPGTGFQRANNPQGRVSRMPEARNVQYPVARQTLPVPGPVMNVARASFPADPASRPPAARRQPYSGYVAGPGVGGQQRPAAAGAGDGAAEAPELTPEQINPFLPTGAVAEDPADRQVKVECPTFITTTMKTRYSYEVLEAMGCEPGFNY